MVVCNKFFEQLNAMFENEYESIGQGHFRLHTALSSLLNLQFLLLLIFVLLFQDIVSRSLEWNFQDKPMLQNISLRCIFYFLDCWWYLEIYNWRYVEIVGNIGNFRVWSSANKCVWHTINTASRSGLKLTRPQLGQKFYELIIFHIWPEK